jgi:xanthine dehydrogenase accessory factor
MRDIIADIDRWLQQDIPVALATIVNTWGSAPRKVGAHMAISANGAIAGSVSGGCVESAVVDEALAVIKNNAPVFLHYGITDERSWEVGLACGGELDVVVTPLNIEVYRQLRAAIHAEQTAAYAITTAGPDLGDLRVVDQPASRWPLIQGQEFINVILPRPRLVIVGGVQIAIALSDLAATLGFHTTVIDPRKTFAEQNRFPKSDALLQDWPAQAFSSITLNQSTAVAVLTHDPKIDDPALIAALASPAFYVGALGSSRTHAKRVVRLGEQGIPSDLLKKLHAPIGLSIGAETPEEIALAILAQIIQAYRL